MDNDIQKPNGAGRAWLLTLFGLALGVVLVLWWTHPTAKPPDESKQLHEPNDAFAWADKESQPPEAAHQGQASPAPATLQEVQTQSTTTQAATTCDQDCQALRRLLAAAAGSDMVVKVSTANTLELPGNPTANLTTGPAHAIWPNTWLYAVTTTAINTDQCPSTCHVEATISQNMRSNAPPFEELIPNGSILHGTVQTMALVNLNNESVEVAWDSLQLPDGRLIPLPNLPTFGADGYPGLRDQFTRHTAKTWTSTALNSLLSAGSMLSTSLGTSSSQGYSPTSEAAGQFGSSLSMGSASHINTMLQLVKPTIEIRKGTAFRALVTRPIVLG